MKNKVNKEMKKSQKEYYTGLILENMSRPDKLWKAIKQVMPSASKTEHTTTLSDEDGTYKKPTEVADCFNHFFSTIGSKLAASFSEQPLPQNPYGEHQHQFKFTHISYENTLKMLSSLDTKKASGLDYAHARLLRDAAPAVAGPLSTIMNSSLDSGQLPQDNS